MAAIDHVKADRPALYKEATGSSRHLYLLWGDRVEVIEKSGDRSKVRARGREGWVEEEALGGDPLLELYFIDVGQGDGILIRTPNGRHLMIDGGFHRKWQNTGKNAADFVDWKFFKDYGEKTIVLDALIASHCDADHYGGLTDLLGVDKTEELDCEDVRVKAIYHAGLGWWKDPKDEDDTWLGPFAEVDGDFFSTQLVGDREAIEASFALDADPVPGGEWGAFLRAALGARSTDGRPTPIHRLSSADEHLPEFEPGKDGEPVIKVLAPVDFKVDKKPAIRRLSTEASINTNGNSLLFSLEFGACRILLTGDLNTASQDFLLADYEKRHDEFLCDVGKACHHGSDDVSFDFLKAMNPAVTIFSSGDNEGHDHPRPTIVAASAISGHMKLDEDGNLVSPLIYSTEIARSVKIDRKTRQVTDLIYGLVNVRTDGREILCATRDEAKLDWQIAKIQARF